MTQYLDYNASTPVDKFVMLSMIAGWKECSGNSDSGHLHGVKALEAIERGRQQVSGMLSVSPLDIIFTSGATESNNLALKGLAQAGIKSSRKHIVSTAIEHKAVLTPLAELECQGFEIELVKPDANGRVDAADFLARIRLDTLLASMMHVNNETGIIQPVAEVGAALKDTLVFFHVDAAQGAGKLVDELKTLSYDLLSFTAHKMYGPQGIGALVMPIQNRVPLKPLLTGGGQEMGLRSGTLPTALIMGLGAACEIMDSATGST